MLIVNADDWGRSRAETDAALACFQCGCIANVSAMVFMQDSERAAEIASGTNLDVGLHINFSEPFSGPNLRSTLRERHARVASFVTRSKFAFIAYHPRLRNDFRYVYEAQVEQFHRLFQRPVIRVDGHQHKHLATNVLFSGLIADGTQVRRSFHFWPGEKPLLNRCYRRIVDSLLSRRFRTTDYFFALSQCLEPRRLARVVRLAQLATVELMAHPVRSLERDFLMSDAFRIQTGNVEFGNFANV